MNTEQRQALTQEAEAILYGAGFASARAQHFGPWWIVSGALPDGREGSGHTRDQADPQDPRDVARAIVARMDRGAPAAPEFEEIPEAPETEEPTFAPEDDPLGPVCAAVNLDEEFVASRETEAEHPLQSGPDGLEALDGEFEPVDEPESLGHEVEPDFPALTDESEEEAPAEPEGGGVMPGASDFDSIVNGKLLRVGQIARAKKAELQEGWTLEEYRSLQNLIVRIERGEASEDADARERFDQISAYSRAMSAVDTARNALEEQLEAIGRARDYAAAADFDPEQGWP